MSRLIEVVGVRLDRNGEGVALTVEATVRDRPAYATARLESESMAMPAWLWVEAFTQCMRELDRVVLARGAVA